jgi:hypothetical protein
MHRLLHPFLLCLFAILSLVPTVIHSQQAMHANAGIVLGYIPGGGLRWGIECAVYPAQKEKSRPAPGLGATVFWSRLHYGRPATHRSTQVFASLPIDRHSIRIGIGTLSHRWGYSGVNRCRVPSLMLDYRYHLSENSPFHAGSNLLLYPRRQYRYYDQPVWSLQGVGLGEGTLF